MNIKESKPEEYFKIIAEGVNYGNKMENGEQGQNTECGEWLNVLNFFSFLTFLFKIFIDWLIDWLICQGKRERAQAGGVAGRERSRLPAEQGAQGSSGSQDPGIMTWAEGRHLLNPLSQPGVTFPNLNSIN